LTEKQSKILEIFTKQPKYLHSNSETVAILGDSLKILPKIKDEKVDLVFADPPYNLGKTFAGRKERLTKENYLNWCKIWIDECMRVLKKTGLLCFMTATQSMPYLDCYVDSKYDVISRIIWHYDSSGVQARKTFGSMYEPIIIVAKDKKNYVFNAKDVMVEARTGGIRKLIDYRKTPPRQYNTKKVVGNVWEIPRVRYKMTEYETHPTQKPEKLMERIILALSNKNGLVLDPFAGTFTTCAVAKKLGRLSMGIELETEYYMVGLRRLRLTEQYNGQKLVKVKKRLTKNKSKKDHLISNSTLK